jgi:hypothetical protein
MRRRAKRDLSVLLGIFVLVGGGIFINYEFGRGQLIERYTKMRTEVEAQRMAKGDVRLLSWDDVRKTGWGSQGPTFDPALTERNADNVDIIGFMTPIDRFADMTEFILLPLPIECYFCNMPPRRDVVLITMSDGATTDRYKEPVLINGTLELQEGRDARFYYKISGATVQAAVEGQELTKWRIKQEHFAPDHMQEKAPEQLEEGFTLE